MRALLLLFLSPAVSAQPISQAVQAGEVSLTVRVMPQNPVVGDLLHLEVEVAAPKTMRIELPDNPGFIDCAEVLDHDSSSPTTTAGRTIYYESFLLDPTGPGTCHVPALSVRDDAGVLASQTLVFPIASLIPPGETAPDIRDGQNPLVPPEQHINWTFIALATLLLAAGLAWFTFAGGVERKKRLELESAEVRARRESGKELTLSPSPVPREFYSGAQPHSVPVPGRAPGPSFHALYIHGDAGGRAANRAHHVIGERTARSASGRLRLREIFRALYARRQSSGGGGMLPADHRYPREKQTTARLGSWPVHKTMAWMLLALAVASTTGMAIARPKWRAIRRSCFRASARRGPSAWCRQR